MLRWEEELEGSLKYEAHTNPDWETSSGQYCLQDRLSARRKVIEVVCYRGEIF